jgi:hypothetical protein
MFAKEIILKEQLAARCLFQCSPARKLPGLAHLLLSRKTKFKGEKKSGPARLILEV